MNDRDTLLREQVRFLGQEPDRLAAVRGRELYDTLESLGLTHSQFFQAAGTTAADYCAREFGVDLGRVTVERFFQSDPDARWLFPDIVRAAVLEGLHRKPVHPALTARDERVAGALYDMPHVVENEEAEELRAVAEGARIPESEITYGDRAIRLQKRGRGVLASYEAVRRMSVDLLRVHLRRIGERLGRDLDARLARVLVEGDGSAGSEPVVVPTATPGTLEFTDLVAGWLTLSLGHGFTPTHLVAGGTLLGEILGMDRLHDNLLFDFAKSGELPSPMGMKLVPLADQPEGRVTLLDAGYAAQKVTEQDVLVESDKLIHQQWERTCITVVTDFAILYEKARVVVSTDAA